MICVAWILIGFGVDLTDVYHDMHIMANVHLANINKSCILPHIIYGIFSTHTLTRTQTCDLVRRILIRWVVVFIPHRVSAHSQSYRASRPFSCVRLYLIFAFVACPKPTRTHIVTCYPPHQCWRAHARTHHITYTHVHTAVCRFCLRACIDIEMELGSIRLTPSKAHTVTSSPGRCRGHTYRSTFAAIVLPTRIGK